MSCVCSSNYWASEQARQEYRHFTWFMQSSPLRSSEGQAAYLILSVVLVEDERRIDRSPKGHFFGTKTATFSSSLCFPYFCPTLHWVRRCTQSRWRRAWSLTRVGLLPWGQEEAERIAYLKRSWNFRGDLNIHQNNVLLRYLSFLTSWN